MNKLVFKYESKKGNIGSVLQLYDKNDKPIGYPFYGADADTVLELTKYIGNIETVVYIDGKEVTDGTN